MFTFVYSFLKRKQLVNKRVNKVNCLFLGIGRRYGTQILAVTRKKPEVFNIFLIFSLFLSGKDNGVPANATSSTIIKIPISSTILHSGYLNRKRCNFIS